MAYQSLYRRYRSSRFDELVGQQHVVTALKNAISDGRVGHAYLFSGPRGTGKTSTARILGKALNCTELESDGEPCGRCESCQAFATGTSYDLQELDAASNNGVEAIRDLISKVALGSPGRTKVYILDEVHMLTAGAENALLKTLEEPPDHVVFVLATTEPHKVVPTIRSRTQHYEFNLIPAEELEVHVRWVAADAGLDITDEMIGHVLRVGAGSARDTLSALDQVVAAGGVPHDDDAIVGVLGGLAARDAAAVVAAVSSAIKSGRDPRVIGETLLDRLRDAFLASMSAPVDHLSDTQALAAADLAAAMGPAAITRSLEVVGTALVDMRQAPDPRVDLEVALLRLSRPDLDTDLAAIVARLERLEQGETVVSAQPVATPEPQPVATPEPQSVSPAEPGLADSSPAAIRPADVARLALARQREAKPPNDRESEAIDPGPEPSVPGPEPSAPAPKTLGAHRGTSQPASAPSEAASSPLQDDLPAEPPAPPAETSPTSPAPHSAPPGSTAPSLAAVEAAWPEVRGELSGRAKSRFSGGRFLSSGPDGIVFGLPNVIHRDRCADCADEVQAALSTRLGAAIRLELVVDNDAPAPTARAGQAPPPKPASAEALEADPDSIDLAELTDAAADEADGLGLLTEAFPGAEVIEEPS
jgi:DNA polymerase III subunit gamma/tau